MIWSDEYGNVFLSVEKTTGCTPPLVPELSAQRMVDEFGFPLPTKEEISTEDLALVRGFLVNLMDQTLSRSTHRVLRDLLQRL